MDAVHFSRALLHATYELDRFRVSLKRLEGHDFPSKSVKRRISFLRQHIDEAQSRFISIKDDFNDDPEGASDRLISEYRKLIQSRQQIEVIERARSDEVPWSLVPSIEKLALKLLPNKELLITTTADMTYMVSWSPSLASPFVTIFLPTLHRANAFLHVLIGHELFHPLVEDFLAKEQANVDAKIRDECKNLVTESNRPLFDKTRLDELIGYALKAWRKGIMELMCDMGAAAIFGPSALWTISAFASNFELDRNPSPETQFYPPWRLRIRTVVDYLKEQEDVEAQINSLAESLEKFDLPKHALALRKGFEDEVTFSDASHAKSSTPNDLVKIAYGCIEDSLPNAKLEVKKLSTPFGNSWGNCIEEVPHLLKRLQLLVPPSELIDPSKKESRPATLAAILFASWIERLHLESDEIPIDKYREVCRLTLKAIEDADLKSEFLTWTGNQ